MAADRLAVRAADWPHTTFPHTSRINLVAPYYSLKTSDFGI
jgi:hypothetical protein